MSLTRGSPLIDGRVGSVSSDEGRKTIGFAPPPSPLAPSSSIPMDRSIVSNHPNEFVYPLTGLQRDHSEVFPRTAPSSTPFSPPAFRISIDVITPTLRNRVSWVEILMNGTQMRMWGNVMRFSLPWRTFGCDWRVSLRVYKVRIFPLTHWKEEGKMTLSQVEEAREANTKKGHLCHSLDYCRTVRDQRTSRNTVVSCWLSSTVSSGRDKRMVNTRLRLSKIRPLPHRMTINHKNIHLVLFSLPPPPSLGELSLPTTNRRWSVPGIEYLSYPWIWLLP